MDYLRRTPDSLLTPETMIQLLQQVDSWKIRPSTIFEGYLEIVKTRKDKDSNITIHIDPENGNVRKFAGHSSSNPTIQKEADVWNIALDVFKVNRSIVLGTVRQLKPDPSRGWEQVNFIEMPYMGLPLSYFEKVVPGSIPRRAREEFTNHMLQIVEEKGIIHPDLNLENVLVRVENGILQLFPIDWESADKRRTGISNKLDYYLAVQRSKCQAIFAKYYPGDYSRQ